MNVLLIYPRISSEVIYGKIKEVGNFQMPLGIAYIGAFLREKGFNVKILDADVLQLSDVGVLKEVKEFKPSMIGFSSTTPTIKSSIRLAKKIKKQYMNIFIVVGGAHATATKGEVVRETCFDLAVIGEGELTMAEVARAVLVGKNPKSKKIKGIAFLKGKRLFRTKQRPLISDINVLPFPARDLMPPLNLYTPTPASCKQIPVANLITSRGCPYHCVYCDRSIFGNQFRARSPENIVAEIEQLITVYGAKELKFWDDIINFDKQRLISLCKLMIEKKLVIPWTCIARVNHMDDEVLSWMKKAGCWQVAYGIESGNNKVLEAIHKSQTIEMVRSIVEKTVKHGIEARGFFMLGLPTDTEKTMQDTIDFAKSLPIKTPSFYITTILPNTELWTLAFASGEARIQEWDAFSMVNPDHLTYIPKGLTEEILKKFQKRAYRQFYLRPSYILQRLKSINSIEQVVWNLKGLKTVLNI